MAEGGPSWAGGTRERPSGEIRDETPEPVGAESALTGGGGEDNLAARNSSGTAAFSKPFQTGAGSRLFIWLALMSTPRESIVGVLFAPSCLRPADAPLLREDASPLLRAPMRTFSHAAGDVARKKKEEALMDAWAAA